jgi:hypothetical protein
MLGHPKVEVLLSPSPVFPGQSLLVEARFASKRKVKTRGVSLSLVGTERFLDEQSPSHRFLALTATFAPVELAGPGQTLRARFDLPPNVPPTVSGRYAKIGYELSLNVDLPWWPDLDREYVVAVSSPAQESAPEPRVFVSSHDARGKGLYAEMTLPSRCIAPGKVLRGAVSFTNVSRLGRMRPYLAFVCREGHRGTSGFDTERFTFELGDMPAEDGVAIPFRVRFPETAARSFEGVLGHVSWTMEVRVGTNAGAFRGDSIMAIPIQVGDFREAAASAAPSVAIGRTRRAAVWRDAAAELGMRFDEVDTRLHAEIGRVVLELTPEDLASTGPCLEARLAFPRVGLGLSVRPRSLRDLLPWGETKTGDRHFDGALTARGRDEALVRAFLDDVLRRALLECPEATLDDARARFAAPGAGFEKTAVLLHARRSLALAHAIDASLARLPAPSTLSDEARGLEEIARSYDGRFVPAAMAIDGASLRGVRVDLGLVLEPPSVVVGRFVRATPPSIERLADAAETERGKAIVAELERAGEMRLREVIEVELPAAPGGNAALLAVLEHAVALVELAERGPGAGPYR